jgi:hypothetical protein
MMKVLIACEYSGVVRDAFIKRGHEAMSCDLLPTDTPGPHHQGEVSEIIGYGWDMMIAHPPCKYLTIAGAGNYQEAGRAEKREEAIEFFEYLQNADIPKIAIENPIPFNSVQERIGRYHQYVNPFDFGEPIRKRICLWLKGLPPLMSTLSVGVRPDKTYIRKDGRPYKTYYHQGKTAKERARFFPCVADAMAEQWCP